jgi:hypothetical protein
MRNGMKSTLKNKQINHKKRAKKNIRNKPIKINKERKKENPIK